MNGGRARIGSAGSSRIGSAGSGDSRSMKNTVSHLQHELMHAKAETQKVNDQLNCLINLVKRSWTGDRTASIHVANIVGVAPPDIVENDSAETGVDIRVKAKPKSRALNNWAVMTIGLLNKKYKSIEKQLEVKQRQYLHMRQGYLEEQMLHHRDMQAKMEYEAMSKAYRTEAPPQPAARPKSGPARHSVLRRSNSHGDLRTQPDFPHQGAAGGQGMVMQRNTRDAFLTQPPPSPEPEAPVSKPPKGQIIKKPPRQLFRPQSGKQQLSNVALSDLFAGPAPGTKLNAHTNQTLDGLYRLPQTHAEVSNTRETGSSPSHYMEDPDYMAYDDPRRYSNHVTFDVESAIGTDAMAQRRRPTSAVDQRNADQLRARPKSGVYQPGERPMKYETTRPISAKSNKSVTGSRPTSSKVKGKESKRTKQRDTGYKMEEEIFDDREGVHDRGSEDDDEFDMMPPPPPPITPGIFDMKINIDKPQSVVEYDRAMHRMNKMETDFRQTALELQKKLGISKDGLIY